MTYVFGCDGCVFQNPPKNNKSIDSEPFKGPNSPMASSRRCVENFCHTASSERWRTLTRFGFGFGLAIVNGCLVGWVFSPTHFEQRCERQKFGWIIFPRYLGVNIQKWFLKTTRQLFFGCHKSWNRWNILVDSRSFLLWSRLRE